MVAPRNQYKLEAIDMSTLERDNMPMHCCYNLIKGCANPSGYTGRENNSTTEGSMLREKGERSWRGLYICDRCLDVARREGYIW